MCTYTAEEDVRTCSQCEQTFDGNVEGSYSELVEGDVCEACTTSDWQHSSRAWHLDADGEVVHYDVGSLNVWSEGEDNLHEVIRRTWKGSGMRGYHETRPVGDWIEVSSGWTTPYWGDGTSGGKQAFNAWADRFVKGEVKLPCEAWLCFDSTSNVFSTAVGVWIPADADAEAVAAVVPRY